MFIYNLMAVICNTSHQMKVYASAALECFMSLEDVIFLEIVQL
jgi:hypothetical protein